MLGFTMDNNLLLRPSDQATELEFVDQKGYKFSNLYKNNDRLIKKHEQRRNEIITNRFSKKDKLRASIRTLVTDLRTFADLPTFVTLEGYWVASYSVAGEPTLCLPQLLQYLKEKFTLTKIVEKFEESLVDFISATPKQVEGFIKASVLPSSAKSCPLIKRSDADKICLSLYEEQQLAELNNFNSAIPKTYEHQSETKEATTGSPVQEHLFDVEPQNSILMMAQAATSTLMIRVYHRCFGKCTGLYYPSILTSKNPDCIECNTCHTMLSPRRFVGHVHGLREEGVCHWGFNSYNWRYYIRLSKKQTMNNLDEEELLVQFETLQNSIEINDKIDGKPTNNLPKKEPRLEKIQPHIILSTSVPIYPTGLMGRMTPAPYDESVCDRVKPGNRVPHMAATTTRSPTTHIPQNAINEIVSLQGQSPISAYIQNDDCSPVVTPSTASSMKMSHLLSRQMSLREVDEARRELYVRTNLAPYLNEKGLSQWLIEDIVHQTIIMMRKSRTEL